ncbi:GNAT family N-acetyltransferase [Shewanella salipaludis]|uniref:GNAT family N-acetyltransferase n=1 Tax=Shewanella salipaludis TaxID=2723052 RepID=UPI00313FFC20
MNTESISIELCLDEGLRCQAAALVDSRDDNAHPLDHEAFFAARAIIVALNAARRVVGCAVIKAGAGEVAELGYLVVAPDYRRLGLATRLTAKRIQQAKTLGIKLLFATVREENNLSRANLVKAGFKLWGKYLSIRGTGNSIDWYYLPLAADLDIPALMQTLVGARTRLA